MSESAAYNPDMYLDRAASKRGSGGNIPEDSDTSDARIGAQLGYMNDQLQKTQAMISEFEQRIDQVLIPDHEKDLVNAAPGSPPRKLASELSNTIDDLNGQISRIQYRLRSLMERVQL